MDIEKIRHQIVDNMKKEKEKLAYFQKQYNRDFEFYNSNKDNFISDESLIKDYQSKLKLIKKELDEHDFEISFHVDDNRRIKAYKTIRGIQLESHLGNSEEFNKSKEEIKDDCYSNESLIKEAKKRIKMNLKSKSSKEEFDKYIKNEISKFNTENPDRKLFFESDATEYWDDYDDGLNKRLEINTMSKDDLNENYGAIKRNIKLEKTNLENMYKVLSELERHLSKSTENLEKKKSDVQELENELNYLNQIEQKYIK